VKENVMCLEYVTEYDKTIPASQPRKAYRAFLVRRKDGRLIPVSHVGQESYPSYRKGVNHADTARTEGFYTYRSKKAVIRHSGRYHVIAEVAVHGEATFYSNGYITSHLQLKKVWVANRPLKDTVTPADLDRFAKKIKQNYGVPVVRGRP
jgi:hypothetical protein